ncbi:DUF4249 family protein [bacterium]|nr:DUF4249 family protein [bacterium]
MFKRTFLLLLILGLSISLMTGCTDESDEVEEYDPEPVLNAYFEVNNTFGELQLQRVAKDVFNSYNPRDYGIVGADIRVMAVYDELNDVELDPAVHRVDFDVESTDFPGKYSTTADTIVHPFWRYRIEVRLPGTGPGEPADLWAEDVAPDTFTIASENYPQYNDLWNVQPADPQDLGPEYPTFNRDMDVMRLTWSDAWTPDGNPNGMPVVNPKGGLLLGVWAQNDWEDLEWLDEDFIDDDLIPDDFDKGGWTIAPDYQNSTLLYWLFVSFEGPQRMDAIAVSHGYYRYMFTRISQIGSGGDVPSYEYNVNGGLGCFGFWTANTMYFNMERVD